MGGNLFLLCFKCLYVNDSIESMLNQVRLVRGSSVIRVVGCCILSLIFDTKANAPKSLIDSVIGDTKQKSTKSFPHKNKSFFLLPSTTIL